MLAAALGLAGCVGALPAPDPPPASGPVKLVYLVRHGWHTRIVVRRADVDRRIWPESDDLGDVAFLEVGWGDAAYFQADTPTVWQGIDALLRPTPAALHVGGFDRPPHEFLPGYPVIGLRVSERGFDRLSRFFHDSYARTLQGNPIRTRRGQYLHSAFYLATGKYHALHTSNTWAAKALRMAGAPIAPTCLTAGCVMDRAGRLGTVLQ